MNTRKRLVFLVLFLVILMVPSVQSVSYVEDSYSSPWIGSTLEYTGNYTVYDANTTLIEFNLSVTITDVTVSSDTVSYQAARTMTYYKYLDGALIENNTVSDVENESVDYDDPITVTVDEIPEMPVAFDLNLLPIFLTEIRFDFLSGYTVFEDLNGNILSILYGEESISRENINLDISTGVVRHYSMSDINEQFIYALTNEDEMSHITVEDLDSSLLGHTYARTIIPGFDALGVHMTPHRLISVADAKLLYSYVEAMTDSGYQETNMLIGTSEMSPYHPYLAFPFIVDPEAMVYDSLAATYTPPYGSRMNVYYTVMPMMIYGNLYDISVGYDDRGITVAVQGIEFRSLYDGSDENVNALAYVSFIFSSGLVVAEINYHSTDGITVFIDDEEYASFDVSGDGNIAVNITVNTVETHKISLYIDPGFYVYTYTSFINALSMQANVSGGQIDVFVRDLPSIDPFEIYLDGVLYKNVSIATEQVVSFYIPGDHQVTLVAKDPLTKQSVEISLEVHGEYNNSPPTLDVTYYVNGSEVTFVVNVNDVDDSQFNMIVLLNGNATLNETIGNQYTFTLELTHRTNNVTIIVTDSAGNKAKWDANIENEKAPELSVQYSVKDKELTLIIDIIDSEYSEFHLIIYINDEVVYEDLHAGTHVIKTFELEPGDYNIRVVVYNGLRYSDEREASITIESSSSSESGGSSVSDILRDRFLYIAIVATIIILSALIAYIRRGEGGG